MEPKGFISYVQWPFRIIAGAALSGLVVVTAIDVIGRIVFASPLGFAYELVGVLLGISVYAGLVVTNATRGHICIDLFANALSLWPRFDRFRAALVWLLEVVFFALLAGYIGRQAAQMLRWHETFMFLPLAKWMPLAAYSAMAAIAVLATVMTAIPALNGRKRGKI